MYGLISSEGGLSAALGRLALEAATLCWSVMFLAFVEGWVPRLEAGVPRGSWLFSFLSLPCFFSCVRYCVAPGPPVLFF